MGKQNLWSKVKNLFVEEKKSKNNNLEEIDNENDITKNTDEPNKKVIKLINEVIDGRDNKKEDIIKAIKHCEDAYFDEEKELEILAAIGNMQNDPEILNEFIKVTAKYSRFDDNTHQTIKEKRKQAINKVNELDLEKIVNAEENNYTDKNNIIKVLNLIKNEQLKIDEVELKTNIIKIFNNTKEELYDDIEVLETLFQVLDNKMRNLKTKEVEKLTKDIKRKIDIYYNNPGTREEKIIAMRQIPIKKIKDLQIENENINETKLEMQEEIKEKAENQIETNNIESADRTLIDRGKEEYKPLDYTAMLESQEERIRNAINKTEEEKQILIEELYKNFEEFVGDTNDNKKTR